AIPGSLGPDPEELREAFEVEHETRYGYRDAEQSVELVTIRITATTAGAEVPLARPGQRDEPGRSRRPGRIGSESVELEVLTGDLPQGTQARGPAVIELPESTVLVPRGWSAEVDDAGTVRLEQAR